MCRQGSSLCRQKSSSRIMLCAPRTLQQFNSKTFRGYGHEKNKWIQHIEQTELCYTEKSPTVKFYHANQVRQLNVKKLIKQLTSCKQLHWSKRLRHTVAVRHTSIQEAERQGNDKPVVSMAEDKHLSNSEDKHLSNCMSDVWDFVDRLQKKWRIWWPIFMCDSTSNFFNRFGFEFYWLLQGVFEASHCTA